ncbi:MAG TPA: hypothetical protein VII32_00540, partial [Thermoanaerobaculia bacterium]
MDGWEGRRRISPRQKSFRNIALLTLIPIFGLLVLLIWIFIALTFRLPKPEQKRSTHAAMVQPPARTRGRIVLILDDVGFDHQPITAAMHID